MMKIINPLFFLCLMCLMTGGIGHKVDDSVLEEEYERYLNLINKARVTSIQTKSGYIVDCVDINKQPAFAHPLLKNHTLQRKPSFERKINETSVKISPTKSISWLEKVNCPKGTVPIQRITKEDLIQGKTLFNQHNLAEDNQITRRSAFVFLKHNGGPYYGVTGGSSIYKPEVSTGQSSTGHMYVQDGQGNKIVVGWHVSPQLYKNSTECFLYSVWTPDNFKTGCYNLLCSGFIQTDQSYHLGGRIATTSKYGGPIFEMPNSIYQDKNGNWWLHTGGKELGYFPKEIFHNFNKADEVGWGGTTTTPAGAGSPPMGSGHFPDNNFYHGAFFRHVGFQNSLNGIYYGPAKDIASTYNDCPAHFGVVYYGNRKGKVGYSLMFGGPGGSC